MYVCILFLIPFQFKASNSFQTADTHMSAHQYIIAHVNTNKMLLLT